jgi:hypothetical protein
MTNIGPTETIFFDLKMSTIENSELSNDFYWVSTNSVQQAIKYRK